MSPSSIDTLKHGAVMIKHPSSHEFRTRERRKEKAGNVYIRHYAKSAERAITASKDFRDTHLELGQYNENSPHNSID